MSLMGPFFLFKLLEQNSGLKLELSIAERKLHARNERINLLEQQLVTAGQSATKLELEHNLTLARFVIHIYCIEASG